MSQEPCSVCGGTDLNLIDGFYYCVECGTQDVNAQETVVEHTVLADGTFAHAASRKFTTVLKDAVEMSGEWHKWHAFNFILAGLVDELMKLGAPPGFRMKVMWIWTRYMKQYQDKEKMGILTGDDKQVNKSKLFIFEDEEEEGSVAESDEEDSTKKAGKEKRKNKKKESITRAKSSLKVVKKGLLIAILYLALNYCQSNIQLSHICRFIREGRLSIVHCMKFVPKELNFKSIPCWRNFVNCNREYTPKYIHQIAMSLIKSLKLNPPMVPDLRKIIDNLVQELCLPNYFKNLVFSLMYRIPCDFLDIDAKFAKDLVRVPDYEGLMMAYILVALKMTFGLDDQYEITLSDAVDKINEEENRLKSYKLGLYSQPTDRLFSFREWCNFLQFRKTMLCKYYLPLAQQQNLDVDDRVFMVQLGFRSKRKEELSDEVIMDILNKVPAKDEGTAIPISEFTATLTPLSSYTDVILRYVEDPDLKLLLSEDFTQYSLKYACRDLKLVIYDSNIVTGVSKDNKTVKPVIIGSLVTKEGNYSMVFVRNCENKNWLKTKQPTKDHVTKIEEVESVSDKDSDDGCEKDSDHGYDSNVDSIPVEKEDLVTNNAEQENNSEEIVKKLETIEEEAEGTSIFDDPFDNINEDKKSTTEEVDETGDANHEFHNASINFDDLAKSYTGESSFTPAEFNPETFDREQTIKECILIACKKYKIPVPNEYNLRKRKNPFIHDETGVSNKQDTKRKRVEVTGNRKEKKIEIDRIMAAYYTNLEKDLLNQVSEHVKSVVKDFHDEFEPLNRTEGDVSSLHNDNETIDERSGEVPRKDDSLVEVDNTDKHVDSSVMEGNSDEENIPDNLQKVVDPEFDETTHDTKQLFVKYNENFVFDSLLDTNDPEIDKILSKKIEECKFHEAEAIGATDLTQEETDLTHVEDKSESEDDTDDDNLSNRKLKRKDDVLKPLIEDSTEIKQFNYWTRHYASTMMRKNADLKLKFDLEIKENCPKSFNFVIEECAGILDCTAFSLYKHIQFLEQRLI